MSSVFDPHFAAIRLSSRQAVLFRSPLVRAAAHHPTEIVRFPDLLMTGAKYQ
jgi:hypothetical protein